MWGPLRDKLYKSYLIDNIILPHPNPNRAAQPLTIIPITFFPIF